MALSVSRLKELVDAQAVRGIYLLLSKRFADSGEAYVVFSEYPQMKERGAGAIVQSLNTIIKDEEKVSENNLPKMEVLKTTREAVELDGDPNAEVVLLVNMEVVNAQATADGDALVPA